MLKNSSQNKLESPPDLAELKLIKRLASEIELTASDGNFPENLLQKLVLLLSLLESSESPELQKLALIKDHLHPGMSLRHFQNFIIPVERLLGQSIREDSFLITRQDQPLKKTERVPLIFVLENMRSAFNVGSIFRLGDAIGVQGIHLCGYTPTPDAKTSLGTQDIVPFRHFARLEDSLVDLKTKGYTVWALETAKEAMDLFDVRFSGPTALVVGNERFGLEADALRKMDGLISLPMKGTKNSLNVSNALSATAFEWTRQQGKLNV
jgi:23S rRNA (guanosine2251-2'-O)-methyltransferase